MSGKFECIHKDAAAYQQCADNDIRGDLFVQLQPSKEKSQYRNEH